MSMIETRSEGEGMSGRGACASIGEEGAFGDQQFTGNGV